MINFEGTFDTTNALSSMYLWVVFGTLTVLINCDLQRLLYHNPLVLHLIGIVGFFFLFTLLDSNNKAGIEKIWLKTIFVYALFVLVTKNKWYFLVPILIGLLIDQSLKKDLAFRKASNPDAPYLPRYEVTVKEATKIINILVIILIIIGSIHYMILQKMEYKNDFSLWKFFVAANRNCKL